MSIKIIQQRLESFQSRSAQEEEQALREIFQEVVLSGLARSDFFKFVAFHGGTALRIFYGLNRFSEDLDFCLFEPDRSFDLNCFVSGMVQELKAYGFDFEIKERKNAQQVVKKLFVKDDSIGKVLVFNHFKMDCSVKKIHIKIEVDTNSPRGAGLETKFLQFPFPCSVTLHDKPSLFAGKTHALLCREYVKGRDWYDFIWYCRNKTPINYILLKSALYQQGPWQGENLEIDMNWCRSKLRERIESLDVEAARREVASFVREYEKASLDVWSKEFFLSLI